MTSRRPIRRTTRRIRIRRLRVAGLLVLVAAIGAALDSRLPASSPSAASPSSPSAAPLLPQRDELLPAPRQAPPGALGAADGALPEGTTVFAGGIPGVANLDADLLGALRRAATDAADAGVELVVDSGWRSADYQEQLLREAVARYGSAAEAARWVATPGTSAHVSGNAVDIGPDEATAWLSGHGSAYGLCQIYGNEPWHYELRPDAVGHGCPGMYADPTHDPRMEQ